MPVFSLGHAFEGWMARILFLLILHGLSGEGNTKPQKHLVVSVLGG